MDQLVPDGSGWSLELVEVDLEDKPLEINHGYLIEGYTFYNHTVDIRLLCNIVADERNSSERNYEVYEFHNDRRDWDYLHSYESRKHWCDGIEDLMESKSESK